VDEMAAVFVFGRGPKTTPQMQHPGPPMIADLRAERATSRHLRHRRRQFVAPLAARKTFV
jgi:hypothetical protein